MNHIRANELIRDYNIHIQRKGERNRGIAVGMLLALRILGFLAHDCDGATISSGRGIYRHDNGDIIVEETLIVQVFEFEGCASVDVRGICENLKVALNQESIAVERRQTDSALY